MMGKGLDDSQTAAAVVWKDQGKLYLEVSFLSILLQPLHLLTINLSLL